jgi:hypothetical protein
LQVLHALGYAGRQGPQAIQRAERAMVRNVLAILSAAMIVGAASAQERGAATIRPDDCRKIERLGADNYRFREPVRIGVPTWTGTVSGQQGMTLDGVGMADVIRRDCPQLR